MKNTIAQVTGRALVSASKYLVFIVIFRMQGADTFGAYSLLLTFLIFGEVLLDFGMSEILVRDICRDTERQRHLLSSLAVSRCVQAGVSYAVLAALLVGLRYPPEIIRAGLVAGLQFFFLGGAQLYHALFKATMRMERDALAEVISAVLHLALLIAACWLGAGLTVLAGLIAVSRLLYFAIAYLLGRSDFGLRSVSWDGRELWRIYKTAFPLGACLLMGVLFWHLDIVMLSKMDTIRSVGIYSAAYRFVFPLVFVSIAFMGALYPILSSYWAREPEEFVRVYQHGLNFAAFISALTFCGVQGGAAFLMGLFGDDASGAVPVLKLLSWAIALMSFGSMVGPMLVITGRLWIQFWVITFGVALNASLNYVLIPRYSYLGSAAATVMSEIAALTPGLWYVARTMPIPLRWTVPAKIVVVSGLSMALVEWTPFAGEFLGGVLAVCLLTAGALASGAFRPRQFKTLLESIRRQRA